MKITALVTRVGRPARAVGFFGVVAFVSPLPAWAQTASQITPPTFAPPPRAPGAPVSIPEASGNQAPTGSENLEVRLAGVSVEGGAVEPDTLAALRARLVGHTVKVSEIFAAARELETGFARSGHVLTRVIVPAQDLADGATLKLVVVEGFIERVDTSRVPARVRGKVAATLAPLAGKRDLTQRQLERALLLAADLPGVRLTSTLAPGTVPGATVLVVEAGWDSVTGFVSIDNTLPTSLGRDAYGLGLDFNSVLGLGENIYLRASGLPNGGRETSFLDATPRDRALAAGFLLPIGHDGLVLNVEGTDARTAARHDPTLPGFGSRFRRLSTRLRYPLVRTRALTVRIEADFDAQEERVRIIDPIVLPLSLDELRIARGAADIAAYLPGGGVVTGRVQASFGIDGLGARDAAQATAALPLSRQGSNASFQKLQIEAGIDQPLGRHLDASLHSRAQTSFGEVMANAEEIGIASLDAISPLPTGTLVGDAGYVVRGELRAPFALAVTPAFASLAPYAFGATGGVRFEEPTAFERRTTDATAWGGGLRLSGAPRGDKPALSASVEYGAAHVDGVPGHPTRVSFTIVAQF